MLKRVRMLTCSAQYQRLRWDALRKSINGLINKVNVANLKDVLPEIFGEARPLLLPLPARSCSLARLPVGESIVVSLQGRLSTQIMPLCWRRAWRARCGTCPAAVSMPCQMGPARD